jgi:hypothetical protein
MTLPNQTANANTRNEIPKTSRGLLMMDLI